MAEASSVNTAVAPHSEPIHEDVVEPTSYNHKRIVAIALDPSKNSEYAFHWALDNIVDPENDQVVLLNVRPVPTVAGPYGFSYMDFADWLDRVEEGNKVESHELLKRFGAQVLKRNASCRAIALRGDARDEITAKLSELKADICVVGSRGMSTLTRTFIGSVSDHIVHTATCAVIVVHLPGDRK
ncbi:uncharacterized protein BJ171DRAFT_597351 [Polychytrium aggregatum]|uniref:uncharacterized protein n=1 Tax=Polychytrium aggregatum TaxID=110093 RepID=UPI0022FDE4FC|nr:uncharacterized protein BJ171DRAFT_597351 [Polychytrium aggregatum]KAI9206696.1 hypothetical protein BJ171DRAFT_597351 [Polychytrium aggregatum]